MSAATTLLSFEDFERLPDEPGKLELLDGELNRLPPAKIRHMEICHRLHAALAAALKLLRDAGQGVGLGEAFIEVGYKIGRDSWLQPDVSVTHAAQPRGDYLEGAPALAVEIISESNTAEEMDRKMKTYLANGGREVWLIYPKTRRLWMYRAGEPSAVLVVARFTTALLPGVSLDLEDLLRES